MVCDKIPNIFCHSMCFFFSSFFLFFRVMVHQRIMDIEFYKFPWENLWSMSLILFYGLFRWLGKATVNMVYTQDVCYVHLIAFWKWIGCHTILGKFCWRRRRRHSLKMLSIKTIFAHLKKGVQLINELLWLPLNK